MFRAATARLPSKDDSHPHWFLALRGILLLLVQNWMVLEAGPFGPLLTQENEIDTSDNPNDAIMARLEALFAPSAVTSTSSADLKVCAEAYLHLRRTFTIPILYSERKSWLDSKAAGMYKFLYK